MKKTRLVALGLGALSIAGLVGAGVGLSVNNNVSADEVKADDYATVSSSLNPSNSTMRYWFRNDGRGGWFDGHAKMGIHAWGGTTNAYYLMESYDNGPEGTNEFYYYVDIPLDSTTFQIIRFGESATQGKSSPIWAYSSDFSVNSYKPYYLHWVETVDSSNKYISSITNSESTNPLPSAYTLQAVLTGYQTCSSSELNGYGAASQLYTNWISHYDGSKNGNWNAVSMLSDYSYDDYKDGKSYDGLVKKTIDCTVYEKWVELANRGGIDPSTGAARSLARNVVSTNEINVPVVASVASTIGVVGLGSFLIIRRRKML